MRARTKNQGRARRTRPLIALAALCAAACARPPQPDAYGNVEATEVIVSAEAGGRIASLSANEGDTLAADAVVGAIEATELALARDQQSAQRDATASRVEEVSRQIRALQAQRAAAEALQDAAKAQGRALETERTIAQRNYERTQRLYAQQAATSQQLDQAEREFRVLGDRIQAQNDQIGAQGRQIAAAGAQIAATEAQRQAATQQVASADAQVAQASERLRKSEIRNPRAGTVLVAYAKPGEVVQPGQPLYKIASLDVVDVRAYVTEPQLSTVKVGQQAQVTIDAGAGRQTLTGTVSWTSAQAEFTPTPIQTRDARADLVYAIKIRVANANGVLKIGMPADVQFVAGGTP
ncbi:MAG TPA: efflux RND transporter periplasmic adaptor subunit [Vicinamibacterales bacterium]|nr:efflux RND transporter periplasmic adaptor subunit [Vicinamibacterales bacterium]